MRVRVLGAVLAGACAMLALPSTALAESPMAWTPAATAAAYVTALRGAADTIRDAAARQAHAVNVPEVHVPPAPLPGPPRFSPSLDGWLQNNLIAAREEHNAKRRAQLLRETATSLRNAALEASGAPGADPHRALGSTLAAILAQSDYHQRESGTEAQVHKSLWERFLEWFAGLFGRLAEGVFSATVGVPLLGQIIALLTIGAICVLVIFVAYRLARQLLAMRRTRSDEDAGQLLEHRASPAELLRQAHAAAARGQYARAVSLLFRAALRHLDARGVIAYDAARTAGEYRRAVRRDCTPASPSFDTLAHTFTLAAYAEAPVEQSDWDAADDAYARFEPSVPSRAARTTA